jgi:hypothetical protein
VVQYITACHDPVLDDDILRVPAIEAISVDGVPLRVGRRVHVQVRHCDVLRVGDEGVPVGINYPSTT